MSIQQDLMAKAQEAFIAVFDDVSASYYEIENLSRGWQIDDWKMYRIGQAGALALPNLAGGLLSAVSIVPELLALMRFMKISAVGIGYIRNGAASYGDFENIVVLATVDQHDGRMIKAKLQAAVAAQVAAGGVASLSPAVAASLMSGAIMEAMAAASHHAIAPFAAQRGAHMILKTFGATAFGRAIPLLGFALGAGVNGYVINKMMTAAEEYYALLRSSART